MDFLYFFFSYHTRDRTYVCVLHNNTLYMCMCVQSKLMLRWLSDGRAPNDRLLLGVITKIACLLTNRFYFRMEMRRLSCEVIGIRFYWKAEYLEQYDGYKLPLRLLIDIIEYYGMKIK